MGMILYASLRPFGAWLFPFGSFCSSASRFHSSCRFPRFRSFMNAGRAFLTGFDMAQKGRVDISDYLPHWLAALSHNVLVVTVENPFALLPFEPATQTKRVR